MSEDQDVTGAHASGPSAAPPRHASPGGPDLKALPRGVPDPALAEYEAFSAVALTDAERWPSLSEEDFAGMQALRDHPHAPAWVHVCGDRVVPDDLPVLRERAADAAQRSWEPRGEVWARPAWVDELVQRVSTTVPHYRALARREGRAPRSLDDVAPVSRDDLGRGVADFVPVDVPLDRVLEGSSSGSTGAALVVPLHPLSTAAEVVYLTDLAARAGVSWEAEPGRTCLLNVVDQRTAFTYASALTAKGGAPMARVNVHPDGWRTPGDREAFFADADAQVLSGNPLSLLALADLEVDLHPLVVFSGAAHLAPGARRRLEQRWGAPVVDVYGTREAGLVAADLTGDRTTDGQTRHTVLPRRVHVEILDEHGTPVPDGERGDVVVTVDDNPYLPLLRYRTGDTAALVRERDAEGTWATVLVGLEGRAAVRFQTADGRWVPSVDTTQLLQAYGLAAWHLHQAADGTIHLTALPTRATPPPVATVPAQPGLSTLDAALTVLLGRPVLTTTVSDPRDLGPGAKRRFSSDLDV
ncbi:AMP-binding protein [Sanguibacter sp. 4.1]|uniref:AMP-binding protein n=1 Tax=Sanguibacter biliveldensis TaxID=3030830 RepID=A0AAF1C2K7_9MICO|nr:AMP-binding protein [Sanguibacter sp. 4.1]WPF81859.1 AMP-binding protein [Sanguibacter sp. 4.1]